MDNSQKCSCISTAPINPTFGKVGDVIAANSNFQFHLEPISVQELEEYEENCPLCKRPRNSPNPSGAMA